MKHANLDSLIQELYPEKGCKFIADTHGIPPGTVGRRAWELGVACLHPNKIGAAARSRNLQNCRQDYFETWSDNSAYLLGLLWSDGCIRNDGRHYAIHFRVHVQDEHIIHDIKSELRSTSKIQRFEPKSLRNGQYTGGPQVGLSISCMRLVKSVMALGVMPNKSNINPAFPIVPDAYLHHFVRGVIDGDGSIYRGAKAKHHGVIVYGTHRFIHELSGRVAFIAGIKRPSVLSVGSSEKLRSIAWRAADDVQRLLEWIYPAGDYMALQRKRAKAMECFELIKAYRNRPL